MTTWRLALGVLLTLTCAWRVAADELPSARDDVRLLKIAQAIDQARHTIKGHQANEGFFDRQAARAHGLADRWLPKQWSIHGRLWNETAYRIAHSGEFTKIREHALLTEQGELAPNLTFHATQWLWYDPIYAATDNYPKTVRNDEEFEYQVRETYLDYSHGPFDVRVGKQQIVWGESVGIFFADAVNAKDLRDYILRDFDLIRIPQWGIDLEATQGNSHAELFWLPEHKFNHLGVSGSEFEFPYPVPGGAPFTVTDPSKPPQSFSNSEAGFRLSYLVGGLDLGGFYLYTWDKFPVLFRSITGGTYDFMPEYRRAHLFGATFSKDLSDVIVKGELIINPNAYLETLDSRDPDGVVRRPTFDYVLGADYTFPGGWETNVQLLQRVVGSFEGFLADEEALRTHVSAWVKRDVLDGKLEPQMLVICGIGKEDLLYRPSLTYHPNDSWSAKIGADILQGVSAGYFGRFNDRSRLYTELTYLF